MGDSRVPGRLDEVDASVHTVVDEFRPVDAVLLLEVRVEARFDIVDDRSPAKSRINFYPDTHQENS